MESFLRDIPKAELHLHIEGTLEPELMFALGVRNGVSLPFASVEDARAAYQFRDLDSFLDIYYAGMRVLRRERDFYDLTRAYLDKAFIQNVRHAEIFFDPQAHTERGVPFATVVSGIRAALKDAEREMGISTGLIMCFLRDRSPESAAEVLEAALPFRDAIIGVGLDSSEAGNPPSKFAAVFARARSRGFRAVAHAGEEGPPEYIREALDVLHVERIDHGVRCIEDPALVRRLRDDSVPLTMCPLSNVRLGVVEQLGDHPLGRLLDEGLCVTVNSDDPAYFGGYLDDNLAAARAALDLDVSDLLQLTRNAFSASFAGPARVRELLDELDTFVESRPPHEREHQASERP